MQSMDKMKVRELMRPVEEFPRVSRRATFMEAIDTLEKAQEAFTAGKSPQRILLVYDDDGRILGKLSPMDVVKGLEPNYEPMFKNLSGFQIDKQTLESMKKEYRLWQRPLADLCKKANSITIGDFVRLPAPDHMVKADDRMDNAFHRFVVGRHDSLFVKDGDKIVGLIRFSDVYRKIAQAMRSCAL